MTQGRFATCPWERDGELIRLISLGDVVKARLKGDSDGEDALEE